MPTTTRFGIPYPAATDAPDGPGALLTIAKWLDDHVAPADMMCHLRFIGSSDMTLAPNAFTPLAFDTAVYDPKGMRSTASQQSGVVLPIAGRWSFWVRAAVTIDDPQARMVLSFKDLRSGVTMSARGQYGIVADNPMEHYTEEILPAGDSIVPQMYRNTSINQWMRGAVTGVANAPEFVARYLGPA